MVFFGYWVLPLISAAVWLGMLLGLFISYFRDHQPLYPSMEQGQTIAYISDVGAFRLKPLFITGCVLTTFFVLSAFFAERYLRHTGRLVRNTSKAQRILSIASIFFAVGGSAGLILLSIFDTYRHSRLHNGLLLLFIAGYLLSAVCLCAEYQRLGLHYREFRVLRISFWIKLTFILFEFAMAVAYAATTFTTRRNAAAVLEWLIALVFTGYVLSFALDLSPAVRTRWGGRSDIEERTNGNGNGNGNGVVSEKRFWQRSRPR